MPEAIRSLAPGDSVMHDLGNGSVGLTAWRKRPALIAHHADPGLKTDRPVGLEMFSGGQKTKSRQKGFRRETERNSADCSGKTHRYRLAPWPDPRRTSRSRS